MRHRFTTLIFLLTVGVTAPSAASAQTYVLEETIVPMTTGAREFGDNAAYHNGVLAARVETSNPSDTLIEIWVRDASGWSLGQTISLPDSLKNSDDYLGKMALTDDFLFVASPGESTTGSNEIGTVNIYPRNGIKG